MNKQITKKIKSIIVFFILFIQFSFAQFQPIPASGNFSWRTSSSPSVGAIGIGQFANGSVLPAALTINGALMPVSTGEVFRTTSINSQDGIICVI